MQPGDRHPPVLVLRLCPWPKPGLIRRVIGTPGIRAPSWSIMSADPQLQGIWAWTTKSSDSRSKMSAV